MSASFATPLADRTYRRLFSAQVIALFGTGLTTVALALLAHDLGGGDAGAVLGTALAIKMVAYVFIAPVVGGYAAQLPRRAFLVGLDLARAACVALLPFVTEIWQLYLLVFALNAFSAGFTPTFQATIPDILPDEAVYTRALSLSRLAYDLENLLSPTLAALALLVLSYDALFAANGAAFLLSAALVLSVVLPRAVKSETVESPWRKATKGIRLYAATPRLRGLFFLSMAVSAGGAMVIVNTVIYVEDRLLLDDAFVAFAMAGFGAGSMAAALALPRLLDAWPDRPVMLAGAALIAVALGLGLLLPGYGWLIALWAALGVGSSMIQTPAGRLLRRSGEASERPSLFAAQFSLSHLAWLGAYPLAGFAAARLGLFEAFAILAGVTVVALAAAAMVWRGAD